MFCGLVSKGREVGFFHCFITELLYAHASRRARCQEAQSLPPWGCLCSFWGKQIYRVSWSWKRFWKLGWEHSSTHMARIHRTVQKKSSRPRYSQCCVIIHLEPDILEWEVKWALESITTNKDSGGDGIPVELFQILKMMLWKCCTQYASKFGKLSSGHRTGKGQFSFQSQRKAMPMNVQTTAQLHSSHMLVK